MFTSQQYRAKADEYSELLKATSAPNEVREFQRLERDFTTLADDAQWLADNRRNTVHAPGHRGITDTTLAAEEEHILRCLGAALIMQWNTLPTKLRRELFDNAGSMDDLLETAALRGQIARFLHKHKDDEDGDYRSRKSPMDTTWMIPAKNVQGDPPPHAAALAPRHENLHYEASISFNDLSSRAFALTAR